jgi:hypothetical protein
MTFGNCVKIWHSKIELGSIVAIAGESSSHLSNRCYSGKGNSLKISMLPLSEIDIHRLKNIASE